MIWNSLAKFTKLLPGEAAHNLAVTCLSLGLHPRFTPTSLPVKIGGVTFPNPVGLAAGFDKNASAISGSFALGFGSVEIGTVTPLPQPGNPKPRVFRLPEDDAFINRYGFNSDGMQVVASRLLKWHKNKKPGQIIGVNIGANKISDNKINDYFIACQQLAEFADYITINISSPNTAGLRDLQQSDSLKQIIKTVRSAFTKVGMEKPIFIKLAPDLTDAKLLAAIEVMIDEQVTGVIISNTTLTRDNLKDKTNRTQVGGLSGAPLFKLSCEKLSHAYNFAGGRIALIGVGGISSVCDAYTKILLGADLVQLYSSLALKGPYIAHQINCDLAKLCASEGFANLQEARGKFNSFDAARQYAEYGVKTHLKHE
ncbi:quinone-dependent dihydroorotate dehydrogenase [Alphaproteobacteria bacterium]|nr:quinone-dependent dihydroorotate dehydrogenase [Alphaproteobacteria bacterium]MDC0394276.1 quinone-dependent dihydroorotate dehydrogenase [Alphaproteobacteria bacterium]MDC0461843.1 quinone-dependent dihydroorotate dehydrogenase [Alphaproteobacteria bacterium]